MTEILDEIVCIGTANGVEVNARAAFLAKYGYPPKHIERSKGAVLVGPVEEEINDGT